VAGFPIDDAKKYIANQEHPLNSYARRVGVGLRPPPEERGFRQLMIKKYFFLQCCRFANSIPHHSEGDKRQQII